MSNGYVERNYSCVWMFYHTIFCSTDHREQVGTGCIQGVKCLQWIIIFFFSMLIPAQQVYYKSWMQARLAPMTFSPVLTVCCSLFLFCLGPVYDLWTVITRSWPMLQKHFSFCSVSIYCDWYYVVINVSTSKTVVFRATDDPRSYDIYVSGLICQIRPEYARN